MPHPFSLCLHPHDAFAAAHDAARPHTKELDVSALPTPLDVVADASLEGPSARTSSASRRAMGLALEAANGARSLIECKQHLEGITVVITHPSLGPPEYALPFEVINKVTGADLGLALTDSHVAGSHGLVLTFWFVRKTSHAP